MLGQTSQGRHLLGNWARQEGSRFGVGFMARLGFLGPTIAEHPKSLILDDRNPPTFKVLATGSEPISFQWRKDGVSLEESDRYRGVNEAELRGLLAGRDNEGSYDVVVSSGKASVTSQPATLSFENAPPVFTMGSRVNWDSIRSTKS